KALPGHFGSGPMSVLFLRVWKVIRMPRIRRLAAIFNCWLFLSTANLCGQSISQQSGLGAINGVVRDSSGSVIPDARVTLVNTRSSVQIFATMYNHGFYSML